MFEVPLDRMRKLSIKKGWLNKIMYRIKFKTDKQYRFFVYQVKGLTNDITGDVQQNCEKFIEFLKSRCIVNN